MRWTCRPIGFLAPYVTKLRPTIVIGRDQLVVSASTSAAEQAVAAHARWQPEAAFDTCREQTARRDDLPRSERSSCGHGQFSRGPYRSWCARSTRRSPWLSVAWEKSPRMCTCGWIPVMIPEPEDLDRLLFPSSTTLTVDRQGAILTHREAIPTLTSPAAGAAAVAFLVPGGAVIARGGPARAVREQPQADRPGDAQLSTPRTTRFPARRSSTRKASRS